MARAAYPRWTEPSQCPTPVVEQRPIPPLCPPVSKVCPNTLPRRPDSPCAPPEGYTRQRYIVPAAYPRSLKESTGTLHRSSHPFTPARSSSSEQAHTGAGESSDDRKKRQLAEAKECIRQNLHATRQTSPKAGEPQLWLAAESWTRTRAKSKTDASEGDGVTLVVSAANGFTKETWMPIIRRLLQVSNFGELSDTFGGDSVQLPQILASRDAEVIDQVWFLDDYHHGQSMDLNAGAIGPVHAWVDGGRDILNFVKHVLPEQNLKRPMQAPDTHRDGETLPWRKQSGLGGRKVIGIGHSVGGNAMVRAAHLAPDLFHTLFLVEPMTPPLHFNKEQLDAPEWPNLFFRPVVTMKRRSVWSSMTEALKVRETSPFFGSWHDEVWKTWESHHLVPAGQEGEGRVQLATPSWAEAAVFAESTGLAEGWDCLPELKVPCGFLMAGEATSTMGENITQELVWRPPVAVNERIMDAGHLIVHERPDEVADAIRRFINTLTARSAEAETDRQIDKGGTTSARAKL